MNQSLTVARRQRTLRELFGIWLTARAKPHGDLPDAETVWSKNSAALKTTEKTAILDNIGCGLQPGAEQQFERTVFGAEISASIE